MANWNRDQFLSPTNKQISVQLIKQGCNSFFINPKPGNPNPWETQVDAMIISLTSRVPTVNGYSGNWPAGWPITPYWGGSDPKKVQQWLEVKESNRGTSLCFFEEGNPLGVPVKIGIN